MNMYPSQKRKTAQLVVAMSMVASLVFGGASSVFAYHGSVGEWSVTTESASIGYELRDTTFTELSGVYGVGTEEEGTAGPRNVRIERRSTTDGSLYATFGTAGAMTIGTTGEDNSVHTVVPSMATTSGNYVYAFTYNVDKARSEIVQVNAQTGAQGTTGVVQGVRYYAAVGSYQKVNNWTAIFAAGVDTSGNWVVNWIHPTNLTIAQSASFAVPIAGRPYAMAQDDEYLYVAGFSTTGASDRAWHVEKIRKNGLVQMWAGGVTVNPSAGDDAVMALAVNETGIFAAGYDGTTGAPSWRVQKFSLDGSSTWVQNGAATGVSGFARDVAVDLEDIYVAGTSESASGWRIERRDGDTGAVTGADGFGGGSGVVAKDQGTGEGIYTVAYDGDAMYAGGVDDATPSRWLLEKMTTAIPTPSCASVGPAPEGMVRNVEVLTTPVCANTGGGCADTLGPINISTPPEKYRPGKYIISLRTFSNHHFASTRYEPQEQVELEVTERNGTATILPRVTEDLPDFSSYQDTTLTQDDKIFGSGIASFTIRHAVIGASAQNSVVPACVIIDRYTECNTAEHIDNDDGGSGPKDSFDNSCHVDGDANDGDNTYDPTIDDEGRILPACSDGIENDTPPGDGRIDYGADVGCIDYFDTSEVNPECSDGVDNGDPEDNPPATPLADAADPNCHAGDDLANPYNPFDQNETQGAAPEALQCGDGIDNDGDGKVDTGTVINPQTGTPYPADIGCESANDVSEFNILRFKEN